MDPTNLYEVYTLYYEYIFSTCPQPQALSTWNTFKTALLRFLLQEFNFEREDPLEKTRVAKLTGERLGDSIV